MCGRFSLAVSKSVLQQQLPFLELSEEPEPSYNIAPTQQAWVVVDGGRPRLVPMVWGLVPHWSQDGRNDGLLINARAEGIAAKPSFRIPFRQRRCLVPADSFYEWRKEGRQKIPYRILRKDRRLLFFAGIWDVWEGAAAPLHTFSIITTEASREMSHLHNRMPVMLNNENDQRHWLRSDRLEDLLLLVRFPQDEVLDMYRVSTSVNSPAHNYPGLHEPVQEPPLLF